MSQSAQDIVDDGQEYVDDEDGLGGMIINVGFSGIINSMILGIVNTITASFLLIWSPIEAFGLSLTDVVNAVIGGQADVVLASVETAVRAFESGMTAQLGPAAPIGGVIVIGVMTWVIVEIWSRIPISPLTFVFGDD